MSCISHMCTYIYRDRQQHQERETKEKHSRAAKQHSPCSQPPIYKGGLSPVHGGTVAHLHSLIKEEGLPGDFTSLGLFWVIIITII